MEKEMVEEIGESVAATFSFSKLVT